ncbi:MAG: bifunctional methylenetetrahydrofolate dehydrogenase/methenyltetrahydrofolate cyclohydrolase FolD [Ignavibacteria bacterium]|nr:bifunctional methylenetetrahydrofolate dehydrogenase/methenyltetrahydrofolate cyclohydrolase FolD [Ignavibacteria bacterium]
MKIIDGKIVAAKIREELKIRIDHLKQENHSIPGLAVILVGDDPASQTYVANKEKACLEVGMNSKLIRLPAFTPEEDLISDIEQLNADPTIDGILVQLPLPPHINEQKIIETITPDKDVDGIHPVNAGRLLQGISSFVACTPAGVMELLKFYNIETRGKHVVVVGRSNIVGKPMSVLLAQKKEHANAVVTLCHTAASDLSYYTRQADILVAAIGKPGIITASMVKDGAVVIDVGINRVEDHSKASGFRLKGDVAFEEVSAKSSWITPVPGGVGPMTIAMLLKNTYQSFLNRNNII